MVVIDVLIVGEFRVFTRHNQLRSGFRSMSGYFSQKYIDTYLKNLFTTFQAIFPNNTN